MTTLTWPSQDVVWLGNRRKASEKQDGFGVAMKLTDEQINFFVTAVLRLPQGKRQEYLKQVDFLIKRLEAKIKEGGAFDVIGFKKTGSLVKGTVLKPRGEDGVDADVAVYLDVSESEKGDVGKLHQIILKLVRAVYPQKQAEDFEVQPRTLGIHFRDSGLDVDLVPITPIPGQAGYGWQPSSEGAEPIKTSVDGQLAFIKKRSDSDANYRTLVRLAKKWRNHKELDPLRSFLIELVLAHIQDVQGAAPSLEEGIQRFFLYVAQTKLLQPIAFPENGAKPKFPCDTVVVLDPVNASNNVALRLTDAERQEVVREAEQAWERITAASWCSAKGETIEHWKEVFGRSFVIEE
jgi:tRNA nucleotidyltransferase (CCA-adding enzyme)